MEQVGGKDARQMGYLVPLDQAWGNDIDFLICGEEIRKESGDLSGLFHFNRPAIEH